jgi:hypothetical protein
MPTVKQIRAELNQLTRDGVELLEDLTEGLHAAEDKKKSPGKKSQRKFSLLRFAAKYQQWYSAALPLVHQLLPDRYEEFQQCYRNEKRKQLTWSTYTISDYLRNNTPMAISNPETIAYMQLTTQLDIVDSAEQRLDSRLADIKGVLQAELFDDELQPRAIWPRRVIFVQQELWQVSCWSATWRRWLPIIMLLSEKRTQVSVI